MQGLAEVVPVSSSAHLVLVPWLLGWPDPASLADQQGRTTLAAGLHAGSCAGIALALLPHRPDARTAALAAATCLPAAVAGLLAADAVERRLGRPGQLAGLLAGAGAAMWMADRRPETAVVGPREAAAAALAQCAALVPGVSRSGATLTAMRALRVGRVEAARFSLLMSLPVTAGAAALTLVSADRALLGALARPLAVGAPAAAGTAYAMTRALARRGPTGAGPVALYRLGLAAVVAVRLGRGRP